MVQSIITETGRLSFLPTFFPDETLYSLCARFHYMSGNRLAAYTSGQLFGCATAAMSHDFPSNLSHFEHKTEGRLGTAEAIAIGHTLLKFYAPYQPKERINAGLHAMAGNGIDRLKFRLGMPSSRVGATHPLKACFNCMSEDFERHGSAYWHLLHQHPSIWVCNKHNKLLVKSIAKSNVQNKLQWLLPHEISRKDWKAFPQRLESQLLLLKRLATFAEQLYLLESPNFDSYALRDCYLAGAKNAGWLTKNGHVRLRLVRKAFLDETAGLLNGDEFGFIESVGLKDYGFLGKLLRCPRSHLHPAKHLILKVFLFKFCGEFVDLYKQSTENYR